MLAELQRCAMAGASIYATCRRVGVSPDALATGCFELIRNPRACRDEVAKHLDTLAQEGKG